VSGTTLIFDLDLGGHHPGYLLHLARRADERDEAQRLVFGVAPEFLDRHPSEAAAIRRHGVRFVFSGPAASGLKPVKHALWEWRHLCEMARGVRADHAISLYIDRLIQVPLALRRPPPCRVSGIYFRPTFHYPKFSGWRPTIADRVRGARQATALRSALSHPSLGTLFTLDPFAADHCQNWHGGHRMRALADPVKTPKPDHEAAGALRLRLGLDPNRTVFVLLGVLTERKGIDVLLKAIAQLEESVARQCSVVLAGPLPDDALRRRIEEAATATSVHLVLDARQIPAHEVHHYFVAADVVLAPYQRHVGMSALLIRAAASGCPVIASDWGLLGAMTRKYELGVAIDSTSPVALAQAIGTALERGPALGNAARMAEFAELNDADRFADALLDSVT
jgi:glycosyltransferase involved in cell wall biosynthesis